MRIAALVFVALVLLAFVIGCAPYDGDEAAFCDELQQVPSFAELSVQVEDGTDAQAEAAMRTAAGQFRALERVAPRTIRHTVASLGDSADRIAHDLAPGADRTQVLEIPRDDGGFEEITIPVDTSRIGVFYNELTEHRGTIGAAYEMATYAHDECGFTDDRVNLGMPGYGVPDADDVPFGGEVPFGGFVDEGYGVELGPSETVAPDPAGP